MNKGLKYSIWVIVIIIGIFILGSFNNGEEITGLITKRVLQFGLLITGGYIAIQIFRKRKAHSNN